jgi:cytochrome d ubiquinol oxidase subunit I
MVAIGFSFFALFSLALWCSAKNRLQNKRWLLLWALWFMPTSKRNAAQTRKVD